MRHTIIAIIALLCALAGNWQTARAETITYTVIYNANGGTGYMDDQTFTSRGRASAKEQQVSRSTMGLRAT